MNQSKIRKAVKFVIPVQIVAGAVLVGVGAFFASPLAIIGGAIVAGDAIATVVIGKKKGVL